MLAGKNEGPEISLSHLIAQTSVSWFVSCVCYARRRAIMVQKGGKKGSAKRQRNTCKLTQVGSSEANYGDFISVFITLFILPIYFHPALSYLFSFLSFFISHFRWWALKSGWRSSISSTKRPAKSNRPEISQPSSWWRASTATSPHSAKWAQTLCQKEKCHRQKAGWESYKSLRLHSRYSRAAGSYQDWFVVQIGFLCDTFITSSDLMDRAEMRLLDLKHFSQSSQVLKANHFQLCLWWCGYYIVSVFSGCNLNHFEAILDFLY